MKLKKYNFIILLFVFIIISCSYREKGFSGLTMGTFYSVIYIEGKNFTGTDIANLTENELKRLNKIFSFYDKNSILSKLNKNKRIVLKNLNKQDKNDLLKILNFAIQLSKDTKGSYDITIGPLKRIWKIADGIIPSEKEINKALRSVGYKNIVITPQNITLINGAEIDCGSIAKGYALDTIIEILKKEQIESALVNIGGDIKCFGNRIWNIGIQHPMDRKKIYKIVQVKNKTLVTSGDYEQFINKNGKVYHHILNPATGKPFITTIHSITVLGEYGYISDALATAFFTLSPKKSQNLYKKYPDYKVLIIYSSDKKIESLSLPDNTWLKNK